ncbi:hypothetical protein NLG97_g4039 [Lecanicillium saksenae]|uniref:Uncharacterized protein n=1 Tax=Lecanicillium saksenae TaxID=468837 RepID=A0ACC1QWZ6_9HYPO|nr:hypothetical protein NLG97_g4039 [Lecanicillium saksenae]
MQLSTIVRGAFGVCLSASLISASTSPTHIKTDATSTRDLFLRQLLAESADYGNFSSSVSEPNHKLKVGIIGAGAAGLYAAILLDSLGVDYEILESSERIGGRIFTHRFNTTAWGASKPGEPEYYDYYDVGAMRFPGLKWMDRVIGKANNSLITYINSKLKPGNRPVTLIPYIFQANNTFRLYNDKLVYNQITPSAANFNILTSQGGTINNTAFSTMSPGTVFNDAVDDIVKSLNVDFTTGFNKLMEYDNLSVRQYLLTKGYSTQEIDWLEAINEATTHYDTYSLGQAVIEQWIFSETPLGNWYNVEGGMDRLIDGMTKVIRKTVETKKRVTAIRRTGKGSLKVVINGAEERVYDHVINTAPLGAVQVIDMTELNLDYRKKHAIRRLQYDPSVKMGIKFKTRWWEQLDSGSFQGGQSFSDLPLRRCVYPSYGLGIPDAPGTMIASYTWGQDSARLGAYLTRDESREHLIDVALQNLAAMHNVTLEFLRDQYVDFHAWDWHGSEDSLGGFAKCGPGQYTTLMPTLMTPAANGRLHFGGEALSSAHAWILGAVNSGYRTVAEVLAVEGMHDKLSSMVDMWGTLGEVDMGWYSHKLAK